MIYNISPEILIKLHKSLLHVRIAEQTLAERYKQQEMRTPAHFGVGQEAVAVGVCNALKVNDVVYSHHRSHNHFLAKGGSVHSLAAELFGRKTGCSRGRGGSVHLTDREHGFIASSAILGESIAAAVGSALSISMDGTEHISTAFFGDAVLEEGVFYESLNYASINNLPVLLVCENNGFSTESPLSVRQPIGIDFCERVKAFGVNALKVDGNDVKMMYLTTLEAVSTIRNGGGPVFLECDTYRWYEHVGPHFDHEMDRDYRTKEELDAWIDKCPVKRSRENLISKNIATSAQLETWEFEIQHSVDEDIAKAYEDPWPKASELLENSNAIF